MITAEKVQKLVELFESDSDLTSMSAKTGYGFLMDGEVPKFEAIPEDRYGPRIIHPMYLYVTHWGGRGLQINFSLKLAPLTVDQSELANKPGFEYWVPHKGAPVVVKRYLYENDYQDEVLLKAAVEEMLKQCAGIYLMSCEEWSR
jgi:hypothetical protein